MIANVDTTHFSKNGMNRLQSRCVCVSDAGPDYNLRFSILSTFNTTNVNFYTFIEMYIVVYCCIFVTMCCVLTVRFKLVRYMVAS